MFSKLLPSRLKPKQPGKVWTVGTLTYTSGGLMMLFVWLLLGDFSWAMRDRSVGPLASWYLSDLGVPNLYFGLIISSFPAVISLIFSPIISVKSDRHRGRWGRRLPFLLFTTPIAALGIIGIGITPIVARWVHSHFPSEHDWVIGVICFAVFWAFFEFSTVAGQAVFGGLINDVVPRELLGRFFGLFRAVSLIDGIIFNYWVFGHASTHFTLILVVVGVFYGVSFMLVCLKVKEGEYPPPPPKDPNNPPLPLAFLRGVKTYVRECYKSPYYLTVYVMILVGKLTVMPVNIFVMPYAHKLGVSMDAYGKSMALMFTISLCLSYFLGWLVDKFHPLRMDMVVLTLYALSMLWGFLFTHDQSSFLISWVLHGVTSGCYFTTSASLGLRLFPHNKFAQFASAGGIFTAVGVIGIGPVVGTIIDVSGEQYRLVFLCGMVLAISALIMTFLVFRKFKQFGGDEGYVAPE